MEGPALLEIYYHRPWVKLAILLLHSEHKEGTDYEDRWLFYFIYLKQVNVSFLCRQISVGKKVLGISLRELPKEVEA